jgi:hypothetical protein
MSQALYPPSKPQSVGEVLDSGFRIFQFTLVRCLPYGVASMLIGQLPSFYDLAAGRTPHHPSSADALWWLLLVLGSLVTLLFFAALLMRQRSMASGQRALAREELSAALRSLPHLGLLVLIVALAVGVGIGLVAAVGAAIGLLLLSVPATYLTVVFTLASPAVVLERKGALGATRYCIGLLRGNWWRTTLVLTIAAAIVLVFYMLSISVAALTLPFIGATDVALVTSIFTVAVVGLGAIAAPFFCAMLLATLGDLQLRREGVDLQRRIAELPETPV